MIFELARGRKFGGEQSRQQSVLCLGTIGPIVAPWKFDVLKASIFVLRTSNFRGATISR